jgi:uncharacterized Zn-finger protein
MINSMNGKPQVICSYSMITGNPHPVVAGDSRMAYFRPGKYIICGSGNCADEWCKEFGPTQKSEIGTISITDIESVVDAAITKIFTDRKVWMDSEDNPHMVCDYCGEPIAADTMAVGSDSGVYCFAEANGDHKDKDCAAQYFGIGKKPAPIMKYAGPFKNRKGSESSDFIIARA